jgi:hypothetical protein
MASQTRRALTLISFGPTLDPWIATATRRAVVTCVRDTGPASGRQAIEHKWVATDGSLKWAAVGAATAPKVDDFAEDTVLLAGKAETDKVGWAEVKVRAGAHIEAVVAREYFCTFLTGLVN